MVPILFVVVPIALLIAAGFVVAFVWSVRSGQLDDLETPQVRMLHDDDAEPPEAEKKPAPPKERRHPHT